MKIPFFMILFSFLCISFSFAQNTKKYISIRILEKETNQILQGAYVVSEGKFYPAHNGIVSIKIEKIAQPIEIKAMGYKTIVVSSSQITDKQEFALEVETEQLSEVIVQAKSDVSQQTTVVKKLQTAIIRQAKGSSLADMLSQNGLSSVQSGATNSKPIVHGMAGSRISLINNGVKLASQHWGHDHAPEIDPFFAHEISVVKGAETVRYGAGAMGGIVIISPKMMPEKTGITGDVSLLTEVNSRKLGGGFTLQGRPKRFSKLAWRLQSNIRKSGDYNSAEYIINNTGVNERNFNFQTEYKLNKDIFDATYTVLSSQSGIYAGSRTGDIDDFKRKIALGRPYFSDPFSYEIDMPYQEVIHQTAKISWKQFYDFGKMDISYNFQKNNRKEYESRRGDFAHKPAQDWQLSTHQFNGNFEKAYGIWKTKAGIDFHRQINYNQPGNGVTPTIPNFLTENYALYALQSFHKNRWKAEVGLRYDFRFLNLAGYDTFGTYHTDKKEFSNASYSIGLNFEVSKNLLITSNLGWAWRPPEANELFMDGYSHGMAIYYLGNRALGKEEGIKWIHQINLNLDFISLEISGFVQKVNDFIYDIPTGEYRTTFSGVYPIFRYTQSNAFFKGIDFKINSNLTKSLSYELLGSAVYATNSDTGKPLPMIPSERISQQIAYRFASEGLLKNPYIELNHRWVNKQRNFDPSLDLVDYTPDAYHLFGIKTGMTLIGKNQKKLFFDIGMDNVFNVLYKEYTDRFRYFAHLPGRQLKFVTTFQF